MRCDLPQGRYVIIPTTFKPFILGDYMLRLFTDVDSGCRELVKDKPDVKCWTPIVGYPQAVSHIFVKEANISQNVENGNHPYVIISCEGKSVRSTVKKDTYQPNFETSAVFYRKKVTKPLTVQVWSDRFGNDTFLGQVVLSGLPTDNSGPQELQLKKKGSDMADDMPGTISLLIATSNELTAI